MLEFLFEPMVDFVIYTNTGQPTNFGCPDYCVEPNSETHQWLKILLMPITLIVISAGITLGVLFKLGKLGRFALKDPMAKMIEKGKKKKQKEPKSIKELEHAIRKEKKQEFLESIEVNEDPFEKFVQMQDPQHPVKSNLEAVRTEAKDNEILVPEQKMLNEMAENEQKQIEDQAKQVAELMEKEGLSEDEAVDRILSQEAKKTDDTLHDIESEEDEEVDLENRDVFKQDRPKPKFKSKALIKFQRHFEKKEKPKYKWKLNDLGIKRRDEYAEQIELKLSNWAFPLPKYSGKNQDEQKDQTEVESDLKKLALFLSMGELMKDKHRKKRMYWEKIKIATK